MFDIITQKLTEIEQQSNVKLLYVAESGSRAWGFSSIDSDYDVRGVFIYPYEQYLTIDECKETFEWIEDKWFDVGAWELKKTLRLLRKSNPVLIEWLQSPIIYQAYPTIQQQLLALAEQYYQPRAVLHHYRGIAKTTSASIAEGKIKLKKWFYLLRALLAAYWTVSQDSMPPMELAKLLAVLPESTLKQEINELITFKQDKDESYLWTPTASLQTLIEKLWQDTEIQLPERVTPDTELLNQWFRKTLHEINYR